MKNSMEQGDEAGEIQKRLFDSLFEEDDNTEEEDDDTTEEEA